MSAATAAVIIKEAKSDFLSLVRDTYNDHDGDIEATVNCVVCRLQGDSALLELMVREAIKPLAL